MKLLYKLTPLLAGLTSLLYILKGESLESGVFLIASLVASLLVLKQDEVERAKIEGEK